jgi:hypothetical protein
LSLSDSDFESLEVEQMLGPRKADGSLPDITFMKPKAGSLPIDKGVDIGFSYNGSAPDLGYVER